MKLPSRLAAGEASLSAKPAPICSSGVCEIEPAVTLADGNYFWALVGQNSAGVGYWSDQIPFQVSGGTVTIPAKPVPIAPTGSITDTTPAYQWNEVPTATEYLVIVKNTDTDTWVYWVWHDASSVCTSGVCEVVPAVSLANGNYYWALVGQNNAGVGHWSDEIVFNVN